MTDAELLARLDRISLLLAALLGVELVELLDVGELPFVVVAAAVVVAGFAYLWGRSLYRLFAG